MNLLYTNSVSRNDFLKNILTKIDEREIILIATPFFTDYETINFFLEKKCEIRLIVRLCEATSYIALENLFENKNVQIRYFTEKSFHSKMYVLGGKLIIIGSSNLTISGLKNNREINVGILPEDSRFKEIEKVFEEYWEESYILTRSALKRFKEVKDDYENSINAISKKFEENLNDDVFKKKHLEDISAKKIAIATKVKKRGKIPDELQQLMIEKSRIANSKSVICLNTNMRYDSLTTASKEVYNTVRGYGYIGDVCKGIRKHYKQKIWRFEEDYIKMSTDERQQLIDELNTKSNYKTKTIMLYKDNKFDKMEELGRELFDKKIIEVNNYENITHTSRIISARIAKAKELDCCFFTLNNNGEEEYVFFAEYIQEYIGHEKINEEPIGKTVEELKEYFEAIFNLELGDFRIIDLLQSIQNKFFKIDNQYYKSFANLKAENLYDEVINKEMAINLLKNNFCKSINNISYNEIEKSNKRVYYKRKKYIFNKKNDYVDKFVENVTKENVLKFIDLEY